MLTISRFTFVFVISVICQRRSQVTTHVDINILQILHQVYLFGAIRAGR
jgi:hypothetical protein